MSSFKPEQIVPMFHIDVTADARGPKPTDQGDQQELIVGLLRQLVLGQQQQNELLTHLVQMTNANQRQRAQELGQWKEANPDLVRGCRDAAVALTQGQAQFLRHLTEEVLENEDSLVEGEYMLNEFVDRFGARLAQINGIIQVLSQLGGTPSESAV